MHILLQVKAKVTAEFCARATTLVLQMTMRIQRPVNYCPTIDDPNAVFTESDIEAAQNLVVFLNPTITFPTYSSNIFYGTQTNTLTYYPNKGANAYTLNWLITLAGTTYAKVKNTGAVLRVLFDWDCNLDFNSCQNTLKVYQYNGGNYTIGTTTGIVNYQQTSVIYQNATGGYMQDLNTYVGVTLIIESSGTAKKFNFNKLLIQIGMALTFIAFCKMAMDFIVSAFMDKNHHFFEATVKESADFSDLKEGLDAIKNQREIQELLDEDYDPNTGMA